MNFIAAVNCAFAEVAVLAKEKFFGAASADVMHFTQAVHAQSRARAVVQNAVSRHELVPPHL